MPKAILEFNLPEEREEYETTCKAGAMHCILWELDMTYLRSALKYESSSDPKLAELLKTHPEITVSVLEAVREQLYELFNEYEVKL